MGFLQVIWLLDRVLHDTQGQLTLVIVYSDTLPATSASAGRFYFRYFFVPELMGIRCSLHLQLGTDLESIRPAPHCCKLQDCSYLQHMDDMTLEGRNAETVCDPDTVTLHLRANSACKASSGVVGLKMRDDVRWLIVLKFSCGCSLWCRYKIKSEFTKPASEAGLDDRT